MVNSVEGKNPSDTWLTALMFIMKNGEKQGGLSREILNLVTVIRNPMEVYTDIDVLFRKHIGSKWISKGAECVFPTMPNSGRSTNTSWTKSYWGRLTRYREKIDQIDFVIRRLRNKPHSKQLSCVVFDPEVDMQPHRPFNPRMPCMIAVDIKVRDGKLNLFTMFRSHDFGRKAYGNYIGLGKLLSMLSRETGYKIGEIVCYSISAHIRPRESAFINDLLKEYCECKRASPRKVGRETLIEAYSPV